MPPQISDDESSDGPDEIPARPPPVKPETPPAEDKSDEDEDGDEEEEEDEYKVEKILKHAFTDDGTAIYLIKWDGYEDPKDQTWEPLSNLENAPELVEAYHKKIGGPPQMKSASKKRGRKSTAEAEEQEPEPKKRSRKSETNGTSVIKGLPEGSWESYIKRISSILEDPPEPGKGSKDGQSTLITLAEWNDGKKTQHPMTTMRRKAPQKLLDYYEQHLVFKKDGPDAT